jgi:hypothetical protein
MVAMIAMNFMVYVVEGSVRGVSGRGRGGLYKELVDEIE